jgi:DNA-binding transcriptional regulator YiaG
VSYLDIVSSRDVRRIRESLALTQEEFAAKLNVTPRSVQRWEAGWKVARPYQALISGLAQGIELSQSA